jgi:cyanophycin synthetase
MKKVKTVQGLNLQSPTTYVEIDDVKESKAVSKLLNLIQSFHPIFIESYKFNSGTLTISSKLPALWREASNTLRALSKDEITYDEANDYLLNTVIKLQIKSMSTIPILYKAQEKGYETTLTFVDEGIIPDVKAGFGYKWNRYYTLGCGKGSQVTCSISSTKDSSFAKNIQQDKWATNKIIERMGLPLPKWDIIKNREDVDRLWNEYEKPVVIKPTGLTGGKGVTVCINDKAKAYQALEYALNKTEEKTRKEWQKKIMIQEQAEGDPNGADYRLLVINGRLKACTKRIPAFVVGDGKSSIEKLIIEENNDPKRDLTNPAHILKPIEIDQPLKEFLEKNNLNLSSIPEKNQRVYVRNVASMSRGGITEDFTDRVSPEIRTIVESIAATMHVFTLGLDIICNDISKPLTKDNGAILEVNTMPESYLNFYPVIGQDRTDALDYYIEHLLKDNNTQKIVVIGQTKDDIPTLLRDKEVVNRDANVGFYKNNKIIINNCEFNENIENWRALEALKVNALLDTIILQYRDLDEVREHGLGFDRIDTLFITADIKNDKNAMRTFRKYKRKGLINRIKKI